MKTDTAVTLDRLTGRAGQLYSLPTVAMRVLELTNNPAVDTRALKECIENDPALTSKILRVVNSSLFGLSREVSDLNQALALLGTKPLKLLVLGFSLPGGLFTAVEGEILAHYWRHTLTKAVAGREISETLWHLPGDDAFIAGLLQDLGMLLLIQQLGDPYVQFLRKAWGGKKNLAALERDSLGFDHTEVSARLLERWGLPAPLLEAVAGDPQYQAGEPVQESPPLPQIIYLAELVTRLVAGNCPEVLAELLQVGQDSCNLTKDQLNALVERLEEKVRHLADVLSLQLPEGLEYRDVLVEAHERLAEVACEAAANLVQARIEGGGLAEEKESLAAEIQNLHRAVASLTVRPKEESASPAPSPHIKGVASPAPAGASAGEKAPVAVAGSPVAMHEPRGFGPTGDDAHPVPAGQMSLQSCFLRESADPGLTMHLVAAVAACRQARCALSLLLIKLDCIDEQQMPEVVEGFPRLLKLSEQTCWNLEHPGMHCLPYGEAGFALILPDCERRMAVGYGGELIHALRQIVPQNIATGAQPSRVSVGVATVALPPKNFPPQDLLTAANRCLYGSQTSGGGVVKSIEIY